MKVSGFSTISSDPRWVYPLNLLSNPNEYSPHSGSVSAGVRQQPEHIARCRGVPAQEAANGGSGGGAKGAPRAAPDAQDTRAAHHPQGAPPVLPRERGARCLF